MVARAVQAVREAVKDRVQQLLASSMVRMTRTPAAAQTVEPGMGTGSRGG